MKITREVFKDYKRTEKVTIKTGLLLSGYFNDLLNRAYLKADLDHWNEPRLTRLSNRSFQLYRCGVLFVFKIS
jgi:hypothetical protein